MRRLLATLVAATLLGGASCGGSVSQTAPDPVTVTVPPRVRPARPPAPCPAADPPDPGRERALEKRANRLRARLDRAQDRLRAIRERARVRRLKAKRPHSIVGAGRVLQALGYDISEHPRFGGVEPVHAPNSKHYPPCSCAIDINWRGGGSERVRLTWASHWLRSRGFFVLWLVPDHYDHLHADAR